jgi:hypothetical protein
MSDARNWDKSGDKSGNEIGAQAVQSVRYKKQKALGNCLRAFSRGFPRILVGSTGIEPVTPAV